MTYALLALGLLLGCIVSIMAAVSRRDQLEDLSIHNDIEPKMREQSFTPVGNSWRKESPGYLHMLEVHVMGRDELKLELRSMPGPHMPQGARLEFEGSDVTVWHGGQRWRGDADRVLAALFPHAVVELERVRKPRAARLSFMEFSQQTWCIDRFVSSATSGLARAALGALVPELARQMTDAVEAMRWPEPDPAKLFRRIHEGVPPESPERISALALMLTNFPDDPTTRARERELLTDGSPRELLEVFRRSSRSIIPRLDDDRLAVLLHEVLRGDFTADNLPRSIYERLDTKDIANLKLPASLRLELLRRHGGATPTRQLAPLLVQAISKTLTAEHQQPWFAWIRDHGEAGLLRVVRELARTPGAVRARGAWFGALAKWGENARWDEELESLWVLGLESEVPSHHNQALAMLAERGGRDSLPKLHAALERGHPAGSLRLQRAMNAIVARVGEDATRGMLTLSEEDARRGALTASAETGALSSAEDG